MFVELGLKADLLFEVNTDKMGILGRGVNLLAL